MTSARTSPAVNTLPRLAWLFLVTSLLFGCGRESPVPEEPQPPLAEPREIGREADSIQVAGERAFLPAAGQQLAASTLLGLYSQYGDEADRAGFRRLFTPDAGIEIDGATRTVEQHTETHIAQATRLRQAGLQPRRVFGSPVLHVVAAGELRLQGVYTDVLSRPTRIEEPWITAVGRYQATLLRDPEGDWRIHDWRERPDQVLTPAVAPIEREIPAAVEPAEYAIDRRQWRLVELRGTKLDQELPVPTLVLDGAANRAFGFAGVHAYEGRIRMGEELLRFTAVIAPDAEEPEQAARLQQTFLSTLSQVRAWAFDEDAGRLVLSDEDAQSLAAFSPVD